MTPLAQSPAIRRAAARHRAVGAAAVGVTLVLYAVTMAPSVSFWDTGEFITCAYTLGIPHPPGSPLYVLLGRLFSLVPIGTVATRVVFMSVLASAAAVGFTYGSVAMLARRALDGHPLRPWGDARDVSVSLGAAVAAGCLATSYTFWFNGTEAEVYAYSLLFVCGGLWLMLRWEGTGHGARHDAWLLLIAYVFGLGGGVHLLCLLTVPSLLVLAWFADPGLRRASRRTFGLLAGATVLFGLGYSTYLTLLIRSGLDPAIDMNNPETLRNFLAS